MIVKNTFGTIDLTIEEFINSEETLELTGSVKWFDSSKGYGFLVSPHLANEEILIHASILKKEGFQTLSPGSTINCIAKKTEKGYNCIKIISIDLSTCNDTEQQLSLNIKDICNISGYERVIVKWFSIEKGFGFVSRGEGTEDIFIHMEVVRRFGVLQLLPGQVVLVRYGKGEKGLIATEIHPDVSPKFLHNS